MQALRMLAITFGLAHLGLFALVALGRFAYPYELFSTGGAILDHIERVQQHLPLYSPPTVDFAALPSPPLYYQVAAWLAHFAPAFAAARLVSIACTLILAGCVWRLSHSHGATRFWAAAATGLFFGGFTLAGFVYDLERPDMLAMAIAGVAIIVVTESRGAIGAAAAGLLFGAAFWADQSVLVLVVAVMLGLLFLGQGTRALAFLGAAAVVTVPILLWLHAWTLFFGWRPLHGSGAIAFVADDLGRALLVTAASCAVLGTLFRRPSVLAWLLLAGLGAALWAALRGGHSVLLWFPLGCVALAIFATRLETLIIGQPWARRAGALMAGLVVLQLLAFAHDPRRQIPTAEDAYRAAQLVDTVHRLEREGEVLVPGHGHLTQPRHFHLAAGLPPDFPDAVRAHRFKAILLDDASQLDLPIVRANYAAGGTPLILLPRKM